VILPLFVVLALQGTPQAAVAHAVAEGIDGGSFPGAVVVVGTRDSILLAKGYGHFTWSASSRVPRPDSTLFDLASLTKVVATTPAALLLVQRGELDLDQTVQHYLPDFQGKGKDEVTVRMLLEHRSGLRAFLPLNKLTHTAAGARARVMAEPLRWAPGTHTEYSDLNMMLLGWIIERVSGMPLDQFVRTQLFEPLGMTQTGYRPPRAEVKRMMPVGLWHGHAIQGKVMDQNAARLDGVSGHAGLYSTGRDLARYAQLWLRHGALLDGRPFFRPALVAEFTRRGPVNRALGWEMNDTTETVNTGRLLSDAAFGHTGYTGTSIWIDPTRDLFVIVLTNRVFHPRTGWSITRLKRVRGEVADAAVGMLDACLAAVASRAANSC